MAHDIFRDAVRLEIPEHALGESGDSGLAVSAREAHGDIVSREHYLVNPRE